MMFAIAVLYARLNRNPEADREMERMWENCRAFDKKWADYFRFRTPLRFLCISGDRGAAFAEKIYRLAHRVVRFN